MESILSSVKKLLGIMPDDNSFDVDVITHINTTFLSLTQLGVGPAEGFIITDEYTTWDSFVTDKRLEAVKSYMYLKVKQLFDPSLSSTAMESMDRSIKELECRLLIMAESIAKENE